MLKSILIIEPNFKLQQPYQLLSSDLFAVTRVTNQSQAAALLEKESFDLIMLSCSFSASKSLNLLTMLNQHQRKQITPLILVVDLSKRYSLVLGTTWAKQLSIVHSQTKQAELNTTLSRFL